MTFTTHGSFASAVDVQLLTQGTFADEYGTDEPFEPDEQVIALVDAGNCLAYCIEGDYDTLTDLHQRLGHAIAEMRRIEVEATDCTANEPYDCTHPDCMAVRNGVTE